MNPHFPSFGEQLSLTQSKQKGVKTVLFYSTGCIMLIYIEEDIGQCRGDLPFQSVPPPGNTIRHSLWVRFRGWPFTRHGGGDATWVPVMRLVGVVVDHHFTPR